MGSTFRGILRGVTFLLTTFVLVPPYLVALFLGRWATRPIALTWFNMSVRMIGARVEVAGRPVDDGPVLWVSNHSSYLDIPVMGACMDGAFVAKAEVAGWPLFGFIAKLGRTVFVDRNPRRTKRERDRIAKRLEAGDNLILYPEGTSSDGKKVLPFKSSLFAAAEARPFGRALRVQPVSVTWTHWDGAPLRDPWRGLYTWYGDMDLAPHLWQVFKLSRVTVRVEFHTPVTLETFGDRKALSNHCHQVVARGVAEALGDRKPEEAIETQPEAEVLAEPRPALASLDFPVWGATVPDW